MRNRKEHTKKVGGITIHLSSYEWEADGKPFRTISLAVAHKAFGFSVGFHAGLPTIGKVSR